MMLTDYESGILRRVLFVAAFLVWSGACLTGCAAGPSAQRGGMATIGKAILAPITAPIAWVGDKLTPEPNNAPASKGAPAPVLPLDSLASIAQPENPGSQSSQNIEYTREEEITFAAPSSITIQSDPPQVVEIPAGSKKTVRETRKAGQVLGAAQKDTARADAAWLASFQWVQGVGIIVLLVGVLGFAHPAVRLLIGGKDTAMMVMAAGAAMIFGPAFLQKYGNYFALSLVAAGLYWFWSRAKYREGVIDVHTGKTNSPFKQ